MLYLAHHYGNKQYLVDTVARDGDQFVFAGEEPLPGGVYLVVMAPDNNFFQILISDNEQQFSIKAKADNPTKGIKLKGAPDNELFYDYLAYLDEKKPEAEALAKQIEEAGDNEKQKEKLEAKRAKLDEEVSAYQKNLIDKHPRTLTAAVIRANRRMDVPEFEGTEEEERKRLRWQHTKRHYFDNIDLGDPRMLRTPFLFQRVDYFVHQLQVQHPDSIKIAIDEVLNKMEPAEETYKYYLIHFLNEYAKSNIVGMDAVYVHLVNEYYARGKAPWTDEEQLAKIIKDARALEPVLIGNQAPDIRLQRPDTTPVSLYEIESPITVLYFWRYDCGHCKKSTPTMNEFHEKYKDKGVKLVAVCAKFTDDIPPCWEYVEEKEIGDWMHLMDIYHGSKFMVKYNIKTTPQIFILDEDKTILSKRIGAEQLEEVVDKIIEMRDREKAEEQKGE